MQRKFRLTRSEDFKRVRRSGKSYAHPLVVLIVQAHNQPRLKVGVTAGRTVGTAVYRNRAKRLLREAMRPLIPGIASGLDLILIARPGLVSATLEETRQALLVLLQRAQILIPLNES
ncbi:MAG: ribonuclease P protein component [Chloroflexota bacterium]|nr:ribonuclease P protein component [Anaerolineales bacterium]HMB23574.1 ribonuclease P protein component [Anaerolineales bacterium]